MKRKNGSPQKPLLRDRVIAHLQENGPATISELTEALDAGYDSIRKVTYQTVETGEMGTRLLKNKRGQLYLAYALPEHAPQVPGIMPGVASGN